MRILKPMEQNKGVYSDLRNGMGILASKREKGELLKEQVIQMIKIKCSAIRCLP